MKFTVRVYRFRKMMENVENEYVDYVLWRQNAYSVQYHIRSIQ